MPRNPTKTDPKKKPSKRSIAAKERWAKHRQNKAGEAYDQFVAQSLSAAAVTLPTAEALISSSLDAKIDNLRAELNELEQLRSLRQKHGF